MKQYKSVTVSRLTKVKLEAAVDDKILEMQEQGFEFVQMATIDAYSLLILFSKEVDSLPDREVLK